MRGQFGFVSFFFIILFMLNWQKYHNLLTRTNENEIHCMIDMRVRNGHECY
jgi:hypothetical protein